MSTSLHKAYQRVLFTSVAGAGPAVGQARRKAPASGGLPLSEAIAKARAAEGSVVGA